MSNWATFHACRRGTSSLEKIDSELAAERKRTEEALEAFILKGGEIVQGRYKEPVLKGTCELTALQKLMMVGNDSLWFEIMPFTPEVSHQPVHATAGKLISVVNGISVYLEIDCSTSLVRQRLNSFTAEDVKLLKDYVFCLVGESQIGISCINPDDGKPEVLFVKQFLKKLKNGFKPKVLKMSSTEM